MVRRPTARKVQRNFPRRLVDDTSTTNSPKIKRAEERSMMSTRSEQDDDGISIAVDDLVLSTHNDVNLSTLLRVDAALNKSLLLRHGSRVISENKYLIIDLDFFYNLLERIGVVATTDTSTLKPLSNSNNDNLGSSSTEFFEMKEKILLALLQLGSSHKLYRLRLRPLLPLGERDRVCFEVLYQNMSTTRIEVLKTIWNERIHRDSSAHICTFQSSGIRDDKNINLIKWHRLNMRQLKPKKCKDGNENPLPATTNLMQTKNEQITTINKERKISKTRDLDMFSEPYIHPGMSLRERVRARAQHTNSMNKNSALLENKNSALVSPEGNDLDISENSSKRSEQETSIATSLITSNSTLLRLADALRSYVRKKESRSVAFMKQSTISTKTKGTISISFRELSTHLRGAIYGTFEAHMKKRASRKEVIKSLIALANAVPMWLTVVKHDFGQGNDELIMKVTKDVDFHSCVTVVLGGRVCRPNPQLTAQGVINRDLASSDEKKLSHTDRIDEKAENLFPISKKERKHNAISKKRELNESASKFHEDLDRGIHKRSKVEHRDSFQFKLKRADSIIGENSTYCNEPIIPGKPLPQSQLGRTTDVIAEKPRVNENLHFCDADHHGMNGNFKITPTNKDGTDASPRGLKMLFIRLNSGKRI